MPTARAPFPTNFSPLIYTNVLVPAGSEYGAGVAVAIVRVDGDLKYLPCGALPANHPGHFTGFLAAPAAAGQGALLIVGRGSRVTPVVEGGIPLVPDQPVFLSLTPGKVTQTPIDTMLHPGAMNLAVGMAVSETEMVFSTDAHVQIGG